MTSEHQHSCKMGDHPSEAPCVCDCGATQGDVGPWARPASPPVGPEHVHRCVEPVEDGSKCGARDYCVCECGATMRSADSPDGWTLPVSSPVPEPPLCANCGHHKQAHTKDRCIAMFKGMQSADEWCPCPEYWPSVVAPPAPETAGSKRGRGLYRKFNVTRTDGQSEWGKKHGRCEYFVLDLTHDPFALPAVEAYQAACRAEYPTLAADLDAKIFQMRNRMAPARRSLSDTPVTATPSDSERLEWLARSGAMVSYSKDGDTCHLHWPYNPSDEEGHPVNQSGNFNSYRDAIDAAMPRPSASTTEGEPKWEQDDDGVWQHRRPSAPAPTPPNPNASPEFLRTLASWCEHFGTGIAHAAPPVLTAIADEMEARPASRGPLPVEGEARTRVSDEQENSAREWLGMVAKTGVVSAGKLADLLDHQDAEIARRGKMVTELAMLWTDNAAALSRLQAENERLLEKYAKARAEADATEGRAVAADARVRHVDAENVRLRAQVGNLQADADRWRYVRPLLDHDGDLDDFEPDGRHVAWVMFRDEQTPAVPGYFAGVDEIIDELRLIAGIQP